MDNNKNAILVVLFTIMTIMMTARATFPAGADLKTITTDELHALVVDNAYRIEAGKEKHFTIVDARTRGEYDRSHIFSAISVPLDSFDGSLRMLPADKNARIVVYDNDAKHERGSAWAAKAIAAGYANLSVYAEAFLNWKNAGMPVAN